jgi:hypothetical protein
LGRRRTHFLWRTYIFEKLGIQKENSGNYNAIKNSTNGLITGASANEKVIYLGYSSSAAFLYT